MKNLNVYGESFIQKVKEDGKLESLNDWFQVDSITVTQSQTNYLINMVVTWHAEEIYLYNNNKYKLDFYAKIECNEILTIPFSYTNRAKKELIENFVEDMYSDILSYEITDITEIEYNRYGDISKEEVKIRLKNVIL